MITDPKPRPNRAIYIETLRRMTPEQKLDKAFELSDMTREGLRAGLTMRHPEATPEEIQTMVRKRLERQSAAKLRVSQTIAERAAARSE